MSLRVSFFAKSNDIGELASNISCILDSKKSFEIEKYIEEKCGYISFSANRILDGEAPIPRYGYLIPSMWGIYGDSSQGACIVIDEDALIKENQYALSVAKWYSFLDVDYKKYQNLKLTSSREKVEDIVKRLYPHILGTKHDSWKSEQERRLVGIGLPPALSLKGNAVKGIIIGKRADTNQKEKLLSVLNDTRSACHGIIEKNIFVKQEILGSNIFTTGFGTYFDKI